MMMFNTIDLLPALRREIQLTEAEILPDTQPQYLLGFIDRLQGVVKLIEEQNPSINLLAAHLFTMHDRSSHHGSELANDYTIGANTALYRVVQLIVDQAEKNGEKKAQLRKEGEIIDEYHRQQARESDIRKYGLLG